MTSWTSLVVCLIVVNVVAGQAKFKATEAEIEICKSKANDVKVYEEAYKKGRLVCKVQCVYKVLEETVEEEEDSPNGQRCCRAGGLPTGVCKDGDCPPSPSVIGG